MTAPSFATAEDTPLIRVDYSSDTLWRDVLDEARRPSSDSFGGYGDFVAHVEVYDDPALHGVDAMGLAKKAAGENDNVGLCVFADSITMTHPERPLLCIDLIEFTTQRVVPSQLQSIENNLSIGNMGISEFTDAAGEDGIFRGFKD